MSLSLVSCLKCGEMISEGEESCPVCHDFGTSAVTCPGCEFVFSSVNNDACPSCGRPFFNICASPTSLDESPDAVLLPDDVSGEEEHELGIELGITIGGADIYVQIRDLLYEDPFLCCPGYTEITDHQFPVIIHIADVAGCECGLGVKQGSFGLEVFSQFRPVPVS